MTYTTHRFRPKPSILLPLVAALLVVACSKWPESTFELAPDARLPKGIVLPDGLTRADVKVSMSYYISDRGGTATFTVRNAGGDDVATVEGTVEGETAYVPNGKDYPAYELVTINGVQDVIEHRRMEPIFYLSDDAEVRRALIDRSRKK